MKREELVKLGIAEETVDQIMSLHGKSTEKYKTDLVALTAERDGLKTQLTEAGKQIDSFKALDIDGVKKAADEWRLKAEESEKTAQAELARLKFDHALDGALANAKSKNNKAVRALLDLDMLKLSDDGSIIGLKEQMEKLRSESDYLFESETPAPKVVAGGQPKSIITDPLLAAMRRGAGLTDEKEK